MELPAGKGSGAIKCYLDHKASPCSQIGLKAFIDHLDDFIIIFDQSGTILYGNPSVSRRLGYLPDELTTMNIGTLFPGLHTRAWVKQFSEMASKAAVVDERPLVAKDGRRISVKSKFSKGKWLGKDTCISISRDITTRVDVENALRESERRLSTLMSNLPGMAYRCKNNPNWTMEFVSEGSYELTGYKPFEFINDRYVSWNDLMHPEDRQWVYDEVQNALSKKQFFRLVFRVTTKTGEEKWVWEQGVGVYSESGEVFALEGFITDITEHEKTKQHLHNENLILRSSMKGSYKFCGIVGRSESIREVFDFIMLAAESNANVIISGESGTGKELAARAIHDLSDRRDHRFVPVNCGAIPENLIESEFFGYKKGAFSGAFTDKPGFLNLADGGTLFLDEVGEIDQYLQVKLLRAIDGGGYTPVGGREIERPDIRIIAATNKYLKELVDNGLMREDFYYRLNVVPITIPPLRDRKEDLPLLIPHFLKILNNESDIGLIPQDIISVMYNYDWPGNVRELQNVLHRYITLNKIDLMQTKPVRSDNVKIDTENILLESAAANTLKSAVNYLEKRLILNTLEQYRWHRSESASALGITYRTLLRKIKTHRIDCHDS